MRCFVLVLLFTLGRAQSVLLQCYETFDDCMSGVPPASHFVGWSGTDNTQTVVNAFNDLMPAYGVLVDHAGTSPHWGGNECDHLPDGIYGDTL